MSSRSSSTCRYPFLIFVILLRGPSQRSLVQGVDVDVACPGAEQVEVPSVFIDARNVAAHFI
eukprot:730164-Rhodomonas_salina.2